MSLCARYGATENAGAKNSVLGRVINAEVENAGVENVDQNACFLAYVYQELNSR